MTTAALNELLQHENYTGCSASAKLAAFILANRKITAEATLSELAVLSGVSYATISRFVAALNCGGYKKFRSLLREIPTLPDSDDPQVSSEANPVNCICDRSAAMIENCRYSFSPETFFHTAELLHAAKHIVIAGLGTSAVTAQYAYTKLFRLRLHCSWSPDIIIQRMNVSLLERDDVLFAISSSGRTNAILELAELARAAGAVIISLSDYCLSPLAQMSDISIATSLRDAAKTDDDTDMPLICGQITCIDILYSMLYRAANGLGFEKTKHSVMDAKADYRHEQL